MGDQYLYDLGNGYVGSPPKEVSEVVVAAPIPPSVIVLQHYLVAEDDKVVVYKETGGGLVKLLPATGSGRTHTIIHGGKGRLTIDAGPWNLIHGRQTATLWPGSSLTLYDRAQFNWSAV